MTIALEKAQLAELVGLGGVNTQNVKCDVEDIAVAIKNPGTPRSRTEVHDISPAEVVPLERKMSSEDELLQLLPVSAWTLKPDGTPDFVNRVWLEFAGQSLDFVRSHPEAWMTAVHPEDRERAAKSFWDGVNSGQGFAFETRSLRARDGTYRWNLQQAVVLRDADGKVLKFVGTTTDIDEQKRAEEALRQAQTELAHATRVSTMGEIAASIAHEVSQPIGAMMTNAEACLRWLRRSTPDLDKAQEAVQRIICDGRRGREVIEQIRGLLKNEKPSRALVDINETIRALVALTQSELSGTDLQLNLAKQLPRVSADRIQLQQVLLNLMLNAIDSMRSLKDCTSMLRISTRPHGADTVLVTVQDSGAGFQPGAIDRLFERFFTTKPEGLGMGLSISRSIVESHGGRVWAERNDGPGATFLFTLPVESGSLA